jgi:thioredoxin reductase (NADPH)
MYQSTTTYPEPGTDQMFPRLNDSMLSRLARYGAEVAVPADETLFHRGDRSTDLYIVLNGELEIHEKREGHLLSVIARLVDGQFTGEMDLLSTRETLLDCVSVRPTRALRIHREEFRRLMRAESDVAEIITKACVKRRNELLQEATGGVLLIGRRTCGPTMFLQRFLLRNGYPHRLLDLAIEVEAKELFEGLGLSEMHLPVAVLPNGRILHHPNIIDFADSLGLNEQTDAKDIYDVAVVGAGPGGHRYPH